ncbi:MAG: MFS transporter [Micrococcales bacterium]
MSTAAPTSRVRNWHRSNILLFVFLGASFTSLTTRMPLVKQDLGVTATQLGLILLAQGLGSLVGLNLVGHLISRFGTRLWIRVGYSLFGGFVLLGSALIEIHQTVAYVCVAVCSGLLMGITDVSLNVDGTALEAETGRTLMPRMHAGFSLGTLIGAGWGSLAAALGWSLFWMALPLCLIQALLPFALQRHLPPAIGVASQADPHPDAPKPSHWFSLVLVFLGLGILCMTVAEGAANDWLTLGVKAAFSVTDSTAGIVFAVFFTGMVIVRFFGGNLADRIGKGRALQLVAAAGVIGVLMIAIPTGNIALGFIGAFLWGGGVALGFPLFLSAAGEGENSAKRVGFVAAWGYGAFLTGPPLLGFIADLIGLQRMFFVIAAFLFLALLVSGFAGNTVRKAAAS